MHGPINVKSTNNISKWHMGFNSAFKGLTDSRYGPLGRYCEYVNKRFELQDWQEVVCSDENLMDSKYGTWFMQIG
jgi:hypothetical protein